MWKKACFLEVIFSWFFSIFDLKIHRFFHRILTDFAIKSKTAKVYETLRGRMNFKGRLLKKNIQIDKKSIKNEGSKKRLQKAFKNSILGPILASKTPPKSKKNRTKIDVKKTLQKMSKKVPTRAQ